jgi:hypothetical protein
MSLLIILLILFILLAALVPTMPSWLRTLLWAGAVICVVLLILQALGVALPWNSRPLLR